jgi:hypothetical protein
MYTITTSDALKFLTNDYMSVRTDSTVAAAAVNGGLDVILVTNGGTGYSSNPTVTIVGDGTGATANATANVTSGEVESIEVTAAGSGYSYATVTIAGGGGSDAAGRVIIPPKNGHGNNAIEELGGKFVMINVRLDGSEANTISTANDFRKIALVRDPFEYGTTTRALATNYRQTWRITVNPNTNFTIDETVTVGSNTASVVEWDSVNNYLYVNAQLPMSFANGETIIGGTSAATGTITGIQNPGLAPYSGDVLYVENRSPISRAADQIEDVKLVIEF